MRRTVNLTGKCAVVTGAASGLGRATALQLAEAGARLCLVDIDAEGLAETRAAIAGSVVEHLELCVDLADAKACREVVEIAVEQFGQLDALCNIAGLLALMPSSQMTPERWDLLMAINLRAPFFLSQAAIPHLLQTNGAIVNVASAAAFVAQAFQAAYCASKAGLVHLTKTLAMEYMKQSIRINAVAPGGMDTNMVRAISPTEGIDRKLTERYSGMRGLVDVEDVAGVICMLVSDAGRGFHGACINIDAGNSAG